MADKSTVMARIKALHPKTNLSQNRMNEISDRLLKKLDENADEAAIDAAINDFDYYNPLAEIAKNDDRMRDLEAKSKKANPNDGNPNPDEKKDDKTDLPDAPEYMKAYMAKLDSVIQKVEGFESQQKQKSTLEKWNSDPRIKDIPEIMRRGFTPTSDDDYESSVTSLTDSYAEYQTTHKVERIGNDTPAGNKGGEGKPKEASKEEIDNVMAGLKV